MVIILYWFPWSLFKAFKSNPDTLRKCCLFDFDGTAQSEKARIMSKSDQQTDQQKENAI